MGFIGNGGYGGDNGPAMRAELNFPYGVAVDTADNLYIADTGNNRIRKVTAGTGIITTIAGMVPRATVGITVRQPARK